LLEQAGIDAKTSAGAGRHRRQGAEAADKLQKLILGELHHRIKNTLATVSAIASQSFRAANSVQEGQQAMEGRLIALGRAHDLLMQASWANASLTQTFIGATEAYDNARFHFNGPDIRITSGAVIALAMTFNELCTNTTKFGALSLPEGRVEVAWTIDDEKQRLHLTWTESGGSGRQAAAPPQLRYPHDAVARPAIERRGATGLRTVRVCLFAGCTARFGRSACLTIGRESDS
jgi:Signal transduction histidine kinase